MATPAPTFSAEAPSLGEGRYVLVSRIGQGSVGAVYRAYDRKLRVWRAIKVLLAEAAGHDWVREQFDTDARTLAQIEHPNLVRVYDVGHADELPYVVMELVYGGSLVRWSAQNGPMPPRVACEVALQVVYALGAVHAHGVVHGAVKPGNVLVAPNGSCKLTDFGISAPPEGSGHAAPEQLDGSPLDPRTDVYCVGTTLWHLLRGQDPSGRAVEFAGIDAVLHPVIRRCIEGDPDNRFASAEALAGALEDAAARLPLGRIGSPELFVDRSEEELVVTAHAFGELDGLLDGPAVPSRPLPYAMPGDTPEPVHREQPETESTSDEGTVWVPSDPLPMEVTPEPPQPIEPQPIEPLRATPSRAVTPPPPETNVRASPAAAAVAPLEEAEAAPSRWVSWLVVPAAMALAALICVLLLVVVVAGTAMTALSNAADATTTSQIHLYRVLNDDRAIVDDLANLGADRSVLEQAYVNYLEEDDEPARLAAAMAVVRAVDEQAKGRIDERVESTEYADLAHRIRQIREARQHYDGAVSQWTHAAEAPTGRMLVGVGLGPKPPSSGQGQ